ncbi:MAG: pyruvate formate lyase family protein, partial [Bacteroidales bacterium]
MNERIKILRDQSLNAENRLSAERGLLVTRFYQDGSIQHLSRPMQRGLCFEYILRHKEICINEGELIVGERGPLPKSTPTYPEICIHTLKDLDILDTREKVSFSVDDQTRKSFEEDIIPFWTGNSNRDRIMAQLPSQWHDAYSAGVFTEFQEQRAPGHTVLGDKIYRKGMLDIINDIKAVAAALDFLNDSKAISKREELKAMEITASAIITYAERHAEVLENLAGKEKNRERRAELLEMARVCRKVPANKP